MGSEAGPVGRSVPGVEGTSGTGEGGVGKGLMGEGVVMQAPEFMFLLDGEAGLAGGAARFRL